MNYRPPKISSHVFKMAAQQLISDMFSPVIDDTDRLSDTESDDTKDSDDEVEIIDTCTTASVSHRHHSLRRSLLALFCPTPQLFPTPHFFYTVENTALS